MSGNVFILTLILYQHFGLIRCIDCNLLLFLTLQDLSHCPLPFTFADEKLDVDVSHDSLEATIFLSSIKVLKIFSK